MHAIRYICPCVYKIRYISSEWQWWRIHTLTKLLGFPQYNREEKEGS